MKRYMFSWSEAPLDGQPSEQQGVAPQQEKPPGFGVGMPATLHLDYFGWLVKCAFGEYPYLVGSALQGKQWRDVDVRLILDDERYAAMGFGEPTTIHTNPKWIALVMAFSALARELTGLPVDFQFQQQSHANKLFEKKMRSCLGIEHELVHHNLRDKETTDANVE